nr:MAG TPA: hypothetical protein [Caudoviricetes sp.]
MRCDSVTKLSKIQNRLMMSAFLYTCKAQVLLYATTSRNIMLSATTI